MAAALCAVGLRPGAAFAVSWGGLPDDPTGTVDPDTADVCEPVDGKRFVCMELPPRTQASTGDWETPEVSACMYDEMLQLVPGFYGGLSKLGCVSTHHWGYLGLPGACVAVGPRGDPSGCVNADRDFDYDRDGTADATNHCLIWLAGESLCFYD
ncbi:MAG TPA: hypothetical protein VI916_06655 [Acidimicrobiia bacterium]|nr:hypothetical protein [Acidimicrobiia bacterium]